MTRLLMISIELPFPPTSGGRMKSWNMLKYLGQRMEVGLACPLKYGSQELPEFQRNMPLRHFLFKPVEVGRSGKNLVKSYLKGIPLNVYRSRSERLLRQVAEVANEYDVILLDHYESFQYLPPNYRGRVIFHTHNATYLMWERYASGEGPLLQRWASALEARRVKAYERKACERTDLVFASPNDIDALVAVGAPREKFRETYHLGDDGQLDLPSLQFEETENSLLYIGTLNWEANVDGLLWFFAEVWPLLIKKNPSLTMYVVGSKPDPRLLQAATPYPTIEFTGFVKDLEPYFQKSRLFLAPLRFGSGIKVKVLNSMCRGLPIVTTSVGAEGLAARHMEHLSITDNASEMAASIELLMQDQSAWERIESGSRALVREKYTWQRVLGYMESEISALLNSSHRLKSEFSAKGEA